MYDASGYDLIRTQRIVGHSSPLVTARYLGTTQSDLDDLVLGLGQMPPVRLAEPTPAMALAS
ncbi:MAG: hypothetical protein NVV63_02340 [Opitutus sp.]|nr:hypothetical protein [Opitutus sp.]